MNEELFSRKSTHSQPVKVIKDFSYKSQQQNFTAVGSNKQGSFFRNRLMNAIYMDDEVFQIKCQIKLDEEEWKQANSTLTQLEQEIQLQNQNQEKIQIYVYEKQKELDELEERLCINQQELNKLNQKSDSQENQLYKNKLTEELRNIKLEIKKLKFHLLKKMKQLKIADNKVFAISQFITTKTTRINYLNYQLKQLNSRLQKINLKQNVPNYQNRQIQSLMIYLKYSNFN